MSHLPATKRFTGFTGFSYYFGWSVFCCAASDNEIDSMSRPAAQV